MNHESTFDVKTPDDFFKIVILPQYEDFISKNSSQRHALLVILVTYHMYERVNGKNLQLQASKANIPIIQAFRIHLKLLEKLKMERSIFYQQLRLKPK